MKSRIPWRDHPEHLELRRPWFGASGGAAGHFGWDPGQLRRPKNEYGLRGSAIFRVPGGGNMEKGLGLEPAAGAREKTTLGPFLRHSDSGQTGQHAFDPLVPRGSANFLYATVA